MLANCSIRLAALLFVLLAATGVLTASAQAQPTELLVHFVMPGRDIECQMVAPDTVSGNVVCAMHRNQYRGTLRGDQEKRSRRWHVDVMRVALVGWSGRGFGGPPVRVLRYGQTLRVGFFRCTSRAAGLTCVSRHSGHGFFLSNKNQRTF